MHPKDTTVIPLGLCHCGCGQPTRIVKGVPNKYVHWHGRRAIDWADIFWSYVDIRGPEECWPWTKSTDDHGYGTTSLGIHVHGMNRAHRIAYFLKHGPLPADKPDVLHSCDNPPCCNDAHHWAGDQDENNKDKAAKGRSYSGSNAGQHYNMGSSHPESKLTEELVREIRAKQAAGRDRLVLRREYAERCTVRVQTIDKVLNRETWRHVA